MLLHSWQILRAWQVHEMVAATPKSLSDKPLRARARIGAGGRLVIPAEMRKALGLDEGTAVVLRVENGELRIWTIKEAIRRVQERVKPFLADEPSVVDELIAERRAENARDEEEARAMGAVRE